MTYSVTNDQWMMCFLSSAITRKKYKQFLKDCYRQPLPDNDKLLTTASKHYIELAIISKKGITRKQADEFTRKSLHGLTEEILCEKAPIALDHILKPGEDGRVRCVLVEGAPGIGKSTLAWEVCHKWEELESVKQYKLVVLVRLREKKAQEARCLEDLLPYDATTSMKELLAAIGRGKRVLIVCDGFDELPREQRQEGSIYIDLLKGRLLPNATIIVTSRPSVSGELWSLCQHNIDRHLEVIGFTKEDIKRYAESVFSGDKKILEGFLSYITSNPPIHGMMYIPLNSVIVAQIYQDSYDTDTPFPTTMTQLFDALTRALIRRHLVSMRQVPSEYCMPHSLQRTEDISKLPPEVADQLLQLARVAYESLCKKRYVFIDLGEDFKHLGTMKKTTSVNVSTGPGCSYSFLHLTLQEYLTALYIAIVNPSDFKLVEWLKEDSVVVRFLAGMYRHDDYHSHPVYQELVQVLASERLQLVHCAYECPSIMNGVKMDYSKRDTLNVIPVVGYDWYATGYCISHFDERWGLSIVDRKMGIEGVNLLVKGLESSHVAIGRIRFLYLSLSSLTFKEVMTLLRNYYELNHLIISSFYNKNFYGQDAEVILKELIAPESGLRKLEYHHSMLHSNTLIPLFFQPSSVQELTLDAGVQEVSLEKLDQEGSDLYLAVNLLPYENRNVKKLTITHNLLQPLAALIVNITTLTYLIINQPRVSNISVLTNIVQSHHTLEVLKVGKIEHSHCVGGKIELSRYVVGKIEDYHSVRKDNAFCPADMSYINLLQQLIEAANNSRLNKLKISKTDYDRLPPHIHEQYKHLLEPQD